ncbi:MAG: hypothetical protein NVS2B17_04110 [Candidatus Velthaea sp.]
MASRTPEALDAAYATLVNGDAEFALSARGMMLDLLVAGAGHGNVLHFVDGRLASVQPAAFDVPWQVAFRAPEATWSRFLADPPPPAHTDIWAMRARVGDFTVDGDTVLLTRWARAITRAMNLLRSWAHGA